MSLPRLLFSLQLAQARSQALQVIDLHLNNLTAKAKEITPLAGTKLYCLMTQAHWCK